MKRFGIHQRLLLAVFALIIATTSTLGYVGVNISHEFIHERFEKRILFLSRYLAMNAELGILIDNRSMLNKLAASMMTEADVAGVIILDRDGTEITSVFRDVAGPFSTVEAPVVLSESGENGGIEWLPALEEGEKIIGKVRITFSTAEISKVLKSMTHRFVWFSAILASLAGLIFLFLSRSLVRPVTRLARAAGLVANGDLTLRVEPGGPPETRDLAESFNSMLDSLEKSRKALEKVYEELMKRNALAEMGKFSLMIAHEFKNPLSIIKSSLDLLKRDVEGLSDGTMISYMEDEIQRLNRLIEDFLSFARPARPCFRTVDLSLLLDEIITRFDLQKGESGIEISLRTGLGSGPCESSADPDLVMRAIDNILKNAREANGDQGTIWVTGTCQDSKWTVEIEDEGGGIDEENLERIFEPFFTTRSRGTGLGLAYVSQVIQTHNGEVSARNNDHGGAIFRITLPILNGKDQD